MEIKDVFNKIETIEHINKYISNTDDGELSWLEFKSVPNSLNDRNNSADMRATLAKEMCAFANTDGGILAIGVDKKSQSEDIVFSNAEPKLEEWIDRNLTDVLDPKLHGYTTKMIRSEDDRNIAAVIYIPRSDLAPHKVRSNYKNVSRDNRDIIGEYFVRRGTKSERLDENLIRAMYLSRNRIPNIRIVPVVEFKYINDTTFGAQPKKITIKAKIFPDKYIFIKDYFFQATATLYGKDKNKLWSKNISGIVTGYGENFRPVPIFPAKSSYTKHDLKYEIFPRVDISLKSNVGFINPDYFDRTRYIQINFMYSCEAVSAKEENFLFIINNDGHFRDDISGFSNIDGVDDNIFVDDSFPDNKDDLLREIESLNDVLEN